MISIIAAVANDSSIGRNNELLWHISEDLQRFKQLTTNNVIVMGQKTYESLPKQPLPNRYSVVISDDENFSVEGDNVIKVSSIDESIEKSNEYIGDSEKIIFIIGGGSIYKQFIDIADMMYITEVDATFDDADTWFPKYNKDEWTTLVEQFNYIGEYGYTFKVIKRNEKE